MTDKLKSILKVAREYPENLFTIEYRNKNLIHYGAICAYVPKAIVEILILRHGSIDWNLTPRKEK